MRLATIAALLVGSAARRVLAQQSVTVTGVVRDAASTRPLIGAVVSLKAVGNARTTRTDETGTFTFSKVVPGAYSLSVRRLGYEQVNQTVDVRAEMQAADVSMTRVAMLDTVRVRATAQGIYGGVGTAKDLRPVAGAVVQIAGGSKTAVDSAGHFFIPIKSPGAYVLRAEAPGYEPYTMSVTVPHDEGVEVALLLDSATGPRSHMLAAAFADFSERLRVRRNSSAIVPRAELTRTGDRQLLGAIRSSPSFNRVALRFGPSACVFVDGRPRPGVSLGAYDPSEIEAVEVYTASSEASGTLARSWPRNFPCADTGMPTVSGGRDLVMWVVIWLKS
jgi:hypothetical protein